MESISKRIPAAVDIVVAVGFALMFLCFPVSSDDFSYMHSMREWFAGDGSVARALTDCWAERFAGDNIRLANIVFTFFLLLPHWVGCLISGVAVWLSLRFMNRVVWNRRPSPTQAVWMALLFAVALPWFDQIVVMCFQFNYVWATALSLGVCYIFLRRPGFPAWGAALLALVAGAWHEGFSLPILGGMVLLMLLWRRFRTPRNIAMAIAMAVGVALIMCAPGATGRVHEGGLIPAFAEIVATAKYHLPAIAFILLAAVGLLSRRRRAEVLAPLPVFLVVGIAITFAIHLQTRFAARIAWWSCLCGVMGTMYMCNLFASRRRAVVMASRVLTAMAGFLLVAHLAVADVMTVRVAREHAEAIDLYRRGKPVFVDYTSASEAPLLAFGKPYYDLLTYDWNLRCAELLFTEGRYSFNPVPAVLANATDDSGAAMPGTPGLRALGGKWFMPRTSDNDNKQLLNARISFGSHIVDRTVICIPFISAADNRPYWFIYPYNTSNFETLYGAPTAVSIDLNLQK